MSPAPLTPTERLGAIVRNLALALAGLVTSGRLSPSLVALITIRFQTAHQRIARIAAQVAAGRYKRRTVTARRRPAAGKPRQPDPLPRRRGWLPKLVPAALLADANAYRSQLEYLLRDPEMVALMQAAPASLARPIRSLCHMLGATPPPVLPPPPRPRRVTPPKPRASVSPPPRRPPPDLPAWMRIGPPARPRRRQKPA